MTHFSYTAAHQREWIALAASGRLLVVRIDDDAELLTRVTSLDIGTLTVHETLEALTAGGLANTPAFGLCFWVAGTLQTEGLGVIVYGETAIDVVTAAETVTVRATGVSGWGEQLVENVTGIEVRGGSDTADALPLSQGAAWIAGLSLVADDTNQDAAGAATATVADPSATSSDASKPIAHEPASEPKPDTIAIDEPLAAKSPPPLPNAFPVVTPDASGGEGDSVKPVTAEQPTWSDEAGAALAPETETAAANTEAGEVPDGHAEPERPASSDGSDDITGPESPAGTGPSAAPSGVDGADDVPELTLLPGDVADPIELPEPDEQTIMRTPGQPVVPAREALLGDHDGMTVLAEDVRAAREAAHLPEGVADESANMPQYAYALELPGGARQPLDAPVVLGRAPSVSNVPASVLPHLVTLAGDDISRTHVRVAVEGDAVVVTDLHSSNGTIVEVPGRSPQQLRGGEPVPVITGTVIDLGSGITLRVLEA